MLKQLRVFTYFLVAVGIFTLSAALVSAQEMEHEPTELTILMGEYYFQVEGQAKNAPIMLDTGQPYEIHFVNEGTMLHEVLIGQDVMTVDGDVDGYETNLLEGIEVTFKGEEGDADFFVVLNGLLEFEINPGQELTLEFTLPEDRAGEWEIGCFVPGHYTSGMNAPIMVDMGDMMTNAEGEMSDDDGIHIELSEFQFQVRGAEPNAPIELIAGVPYEITFTNIGIMEHEVLIGQGLVEVDNLPDAYEVNLLDGIEVAVVGFMNDQFYEVISPAGLIEFEVEPGLSLTLEFTLPESAVGTWEMGCFVPGHYQAGMRTAIMVVAGE